MISCGASEYDHSTVQFFVPIDPMRVKKKHRIRINKMRASPVAAVDAAAVPRLPKWKSRSVFFAFFFTFAAIIIILSC